MMDDQDFFWFWLRQTDTRPRGHWVVSGPFGTHGSANRDREMRRSQHAVEVSMVFLARSWQSAEEMLHHQ